MKEDGTVYYMAQALCDTVLGEGTYDVLETFVGKDLEYKEYEPLFDYAVMQDPVSIPLERGAHGTFFLGALPTAGFIGEGCPGRKDLVLQGLLLLSNGHIVSPWWVISVQNANFGGIGGLFRVANPSTSIIRNLGGKFLPVWANFFEKFLFSCFWTALPGGTAPFLRVPLGTIFVGEPRARAQVHTPRRRPARTRTRRGFLQIGDLCIYWLICGGLAAGGFSMKKAGKRIFGLNL